MLMPTYNKMLTYSILITAAYLLGSVPFALILAKAHGKDLRRIGSGNIGSTNLSRAIGKKWGYFCFALDVLKGLVPMSTASVILPSEPETMELFFVLSAGAAAVLGHIFPVYLGFKGGKGVATSFGIALGLYPYYTICAVVAIIIWIATVCMWRYISLASVIAAFCFPLTLIISICIITQWQFADLWPLLTAAVAIPLMVALRHKSNIKRILAGKEPKVFEKN
jgi:glycerol-3-phosphate acyltransferase PlsY